MIGIYEIRNIIDNKVYVGKSKNLNSRKNEHFSLLRRNQHTNIHLQNSFNKYGESNFQYSILELCEEIELTDNEFKWIDKYKSNLSENGYNITSPYDMYKYSTHGKLNINEKEYNSYNIQYYTKEELLSYIEEFYYMNGKLPTTRDMNKKGMPSAHNYFSKFKSFKDAIIECNLGHLINEKMYDRTEYTKEMVIAKFEKFKDNYGRFPNSKELKNTKSSDLPTQSLIYKFFNSVEELRTLLGFPSDYELKELEKKEALSGLIKLYELEGKVTSRSIESSKLTKCGKYYRDNFGSTKKACELVNVPYGR